DVAKCSSDQLKGNRATRRVTGCPFVSKRADPSSSVTTVVSYRESLANGVLGLTT
ncbi:hypothetical protein A2U01_0078168, partial [Trifolium medium]|nr:hypothetical protein [Trifolium medium]